MHHTSPCFLLRNIGNEYYYIKYLILYIMHNDFYNYLLTLFIDNK